MKKICKRVFCVILSFILLIVLDVPIYATIKDAKIVGGIDYSGKGTVITGTIASGKTATVSGNYVNIPIYRGKYVVGSFNGWGTKKWSGWSVSNNKDNADFSIYNGSNKATEYSVESRKEYQYKRLEKRDNYDTKYYTKYKGTKWYNSWQTITSSSWNGYPGAKSGYKIVSRYTKKEKHGTYNVTVFDNKWRTSAPINLPWENKWTAYNTRTTYRYKSRTLKWDAKATTTTEQVPLKYSLYTQENSPIKAGIKWSYGGNEKKYNKQRNRNLIQTAFDNGMPNEESLNIDMYYITSKNVIKKVREDLMKYMGDKWGEDGSNAFKNFVVEKAIDALKDKGLISYAEKIGKKGIFGIAVVMLEYIDLSAYFGDYAAFVEYIAVLNDLIESSDNETLVLYFAHNSTNVVIPARKVRMASTKTKSVSMLYDYTFCVNNGLEYYIPKGAESYGTVSYLTEAEMWNDIYSKFDSGQYTWETVFSWEILK